MDNSFNTPLFTRKDSKRAFNYLYNDIDSDIINASDLERYNACMMLNDQKSFMILKANMKLIQCICCNELFPRISTALNLRNQKHGFYIFNPTYIMSCFNPFRKSTIDKIIPYLVDEMYGMPSMMSYFDSFNDPSLEQLIKLKYKEYIYEQGNRVYLKLLPQEDFSFIYDFIDDLFYYC